MNLRRFTKEMLIRASAKMPDANLDTELWWQERQLGERELMEFAQKVKDAQKLPVSASANITVGMMIGFELGRLSCDPSYELAVVLGAPEHDRRA